MCDILSGDQKSPEFSIGYDLPLILSKPTGNKFAQLPFPEWPVGDIFLITRFLRFWYRGDWWHRWPRWSRRPGRGRRLIVMLAVILRPLPIRLFVGPADGFNYLDPAFQRPRFGAMLNTSQVLKFFHVP